MDRKKRIRVMVVDDSSVVRMALVHILNSDPQIEVAAMARNGREALRLLDRHSPDVVIMDIEMPEMDGIEATRQIMATKPLPIVICSAAVSPRQAMSTFQSLEAGAVACVEKPVIADHQGAQGSAIDLLRTVKLMSEVKVVHRWPRSSQLATAAPPEFPPLGGMHYRGRVELIGIGASTGGPPVLQTILAGLPGNFPAPILVVQHMMRGFLGGLAEWLHRTTGFAVHIAEDSTEPRPGHVYLAPDDFHMTMCRRGRIHLCKDEMVNAVRPSVSRLFGSLAEMYGPACAGVILSGMGKDGAEELKHMKQAGAFTVAQDRNSSVVHGMPGEAIAIGAVDCVLPANLIAGALIATVQKQTLSKGCVA
jgi:two-component system chemotaxis response regulator CheB